MQGDQTERYIDTHRSVYLRVFGFYWLYSWPASRLILVLVRAQMQIIDLTVTPSLNLARYMYRH